MGSHIIDTQRGKGGKLLKCEYIYIYSPTDMDTPRHIKIPLCPWDMPYDKYSNVYKV